MSWNSIKIDAADTYFSKYIRLKAKKCAKCGRRGTGENEIFGLEASHFHSRRKESVRFDEENVDVLCKGCHKYFGEHKTEYEAWKLEQMGRKAYDLLELRANTTTKKDRIAQRLLWRQELKKLKI